MNWEGKAKNELNDLTILYTHKWEGKILNVLSGLKQTQSEMGMMRKHCTEAGTEWEGKGGNVFSDLEADAEWEGKGDDDKSPWDGGE